MGRTGIGRGAVALLAAAVVAAGSAAPARAQAPGGDRVRVFLDCPGSSCDPDHLRREVDFVEYVRDREDADVHVLITRERAGARATAYTLEFLGRGRFAGVDDVLRHVTSEVATAAEARAGVVRALEAGLVRYVARTDAADRLRVALAPADRGAAVGGEEADPWNHWVFRSSLSGFFSGEESTRALSISGTQSASHVSQSWKGGVTLRGDYARSEFEVEEDRTVTSTTSRYKAEWLLVRSIGERWGFGFRGAATSSSFDNYDLFFRIAPAIEFNVFPYRESTSREFRFLYSVGLDALNYEERTVFGVTKETLYDETLSVILSVTEPWGSASGGVEASHYLDDVDKNRLSAFGSVDVRVTRGLGLFLGGEASRIRDQINLPASDATQEEILLRNRVLSTPFSYSLEAGLSFTFGSIYSGVVNTRFGS